MPAAAAANRGAPAFWCVPGSGQQAAASRSCQGVCSSVGWRQRRAPYTLSSASMSSSSAAAGAAGAAAGASLALMAAAASSLVLRPYTSMEMSCGGGGGWEGEGVVGRDAGPGGCVCVCGWVGGGTGKERPAWGGQHGGRCAAPSVRLLLRLGRTVGRTVGRGRAAGANCLPHLLDVVVVVHNVVGVEHPLVADAVVEAALHLAQGHNVAACVGGWGVGVCGGAVEIRLGGSSAGCTAGRQRARRWPCHWSHHAPPSSALPLRTTTAALTAGCPARGAASTCARTSRTASRTPRRTSQWQTPRGRRPGQGEVVVRGGAWVSGGGGGGASRRADGQGVIGWGGRPGSRRVQLPALSSNFTPPTQLLLASALPHARPHTLFFSNASPSRMLNTCRKEVLPPGARHGRDGWGTLAGLGVAAAAPARQTTARGAAQGAVQHKPW